MDAPRSKAPPEPQAPDNRSAEALARTVLRCRELAGYLESVADELPQRNEAPFLHSQLDDVLKRLQTSLKPFLSEPALSGDKPAGFLRRLASKKPREARSRSEVRYDLEGNAWTIPVTELVGFLSHSGKSGLLWITATDETFVLEFARGSLVHATSNAPPPSLRLGELLLREKLLDSAELEALIANAKAADDLLGSYLVRTGRLGHAELQRVMTLQVQQLFHRLMDAENAVYRFQEGAQLLRSHGLEVNITQLLLESARKKDEERQPPRVEAREPVLDVLDEGPRPALPAPPAEAPRNEPVAAAKGDDARGQPNVEEYVSE